MNSTTSIFTLSLLFLVCGAVSAQHKNLEKGWSIGLTGSFDRYQNDFIPVVENAVPEVSYSDRSNTSVGLEVMHHFAHRLELRTGVSYSTKGFATSNEWRFQDPRDPLIPSGIRYKAGYFDVPLTLGFRVWKSRSVNLVPTVGAVAGFLGYSKQVVTYEANNQERMDVQGRDFNDVVTAASASLVLEYFPDDLFMLQVAPYFRQGLDRVDDLLMDGDPVSYGVSVGIFYRFGTRTFDEQPVQGNFPLNDKE